MKILKTIYAALFIFVMIIPTVQAGEYSGDLSEAEVVKFIDTSLRLEPLAREMEANELRSFFVPRADEAVEKTVYAQGFIPAHIENIKNLKAEHPDLYARANTIVTMDVNEVDEGRRQEFDSIDSWAVSADRIFVAFNEYPNSGDSDEGSYDSIEPEMEKLKSQLGMFLTDEMAATIDSAINAQKVTMEVSAHDQAIVRSFEGPLARHVITNIRGRD